MKNTPHLLWAAPALMLTIALAPLPYGYYTILRLVVSASAGVLAYNAYREAGRSLTPWTIALASAALIFNPILPVHLTRTTWAPINLAFAALFVAHWITARRSVA